MRDKGWQAMGAFDPEERSRVLDLLGVDAQLVFATFATARFVGKDEDRLYAGSSAQNRAIANFCSADKRLLPVAFVPLVDPGRAIDLAVEAIEAGCAAVMVPSTAAGTRAPTHPDLDGFWDVLSEANVPFRAARRRWWWKAPRPPPSTTTRCPCPTTWAGARTSDRRTSSLSLTLPRCSWDRSSTTASSTASRSCGEAALNKVRVGWCHGCAISTTGSARSAVRKSRSVDSSCLLGLRAPTPQVHAVSR